MSRNVKLFVAGLAIVSRFAGASPVLAFTADELKGRVERVAPPYPTLPGKVLCSCPQSGYLSRAVGYLNSIVSDHGTYTTVDVWCVYDAFLLSGAPAFNNACSDYQLLK